MRAVLNGFLLGLFALFHAGTAMAADGAGQPLKPGEWTKSESTYDLTSLYLYVPQNNTPKLAGKRALMVVLHGCAQSVVNDIIDKRSGWEGPSEKYGMVLAAPDVPTTNPNGTRFAPGCWDWFGNKHQRGGRDAVLLANMIKGLQARTELNIDPNQVYVVGMSSGAGVSNVLGCSYPELIAGVGIHSGPALGSMLMDIFQAPKVTADSIVENCRLYAGDHAPALTTQIASVIHGSNDKLAKASHADRNREGLQLLYGAGVEAGKIEETNQSNGMLYKDANGKIRVAQIMVEGMGHAFAVGNGGTGGGVKSGLTFHDYTHISYPDWVTKFFFDNNLRVAR